MPKANRVKVGTVTAIVTMAATGTMTEAVGDRTATARARMVPTTTAAVGKVRTTLDHRAIGHRGPAVADLMVAGEGDVPAEAGEDVIE